MWLYRTAGNDPDQDVSEPWALTLYKRCSHYGTLPGPGGAYDQDEHLMMAMEQAAGVSNLFDADAKTLANDRRWMELHTELVSETAEIIRLFNEREAEADDDART